MRNYSLIFDDIWKKQIKKIDPSTKQEISKILDKLEENPENIGKPLLYTKSRIREIRIKHYRLYYTIIEDKIEILRIVLVLNVSHKDEQKKTIRKLVQKIEEKIKDLIPLF